MERLLEFRAWDTVKKVFPLAEFNILGEVTVFDLANQYKLENLLHDLLIDQYTGVKDKNGKLIFENDIIKSPLGYIGKVVFKSHGYNIKRNKFDYEEYYQCYGWQFERADGHTEFTLLAG